MCSIRKEYLITPSIPIKTVWFLLNEISYGQYVLVIMYDNKYNEANGEDL